MYRRLVGRVQDGTKEKELVSRERRDQSRGASKCKVGVSVEGSVLGHRPLFLHLDWDLLVGDHLDEKGGWNWTEATIYNQNISSQLRRTGRKGSITNFGQALSSRSNLQRCCCPAPNRLSILNQSASIVPAVADCWFQCLESALGVVQVLG